ncbi:MULTISPECIES: hypothetical protein [unclassified Nostoc]|nr:hypothetical protein [Nostoc sp. DedQUE03]MDZ7977622.1 hypothetical protein [Nostoc sp. DedQUE03]MDZ8047337.1 hypothetical protein [Nostoc sp. DedQUE02]
MFRPPDCDAPKGSRLLAIAVLILQEVLRHKLVEIEKILKQN